MFWGVFLFVCFLLFRATPAAYAALIRPLARKPPYATGSSLRKDKMTKKKKNYTLVPMGAFTGKNCNWL